MGGGELVGRPAATLQHRIDSGRSVGISLSCRCGRLVYPYQGSGEFEIALFTTVFQGVGYLFMMAMANVCYFLGPLSERIVRPRNIATYRKTAFRLGFWFSVLLPFTIPALLAYLCAFTPAWWRE